MFTLWALARLGEITDCLAQLEAVQTTYWKNGVRQSYSLVLNVLADVCYYTGDIEAGLAFLQASETFIHETGERVSEPGLHWHRGKLLQLQGHADQAESCFVRALTLGQQRGAKGIELRVATLLGRLWQDQGEREKARDLLLPIYNRFTEGFGTIELQEAKALLDQLV